MEQSIRERDIEFYQMCVEDAQRKLHNCPPDEEPHFRARIAAYQAVVIALINTRGF